MHGETAAERGADGVQELPPLDLDSDVHVHTGFAAGFDSVDVVVGAAAAVGLRRLTFADQVAPETPWLAAYVESVRRARRRTEIELRAAVEVEVCRPDGWLGFPRDLAGLDAVCVALPRLPLAAGPADLDAVRQLLATGVLRPVDVVEALVGATVNGIERASRYAPTQLARPLHLLAQLGIDENDVADALIDALAASCRVTNTVVEVSEAWHRPSIRLARRLAAAGVQLGAASDARYAAEVGVWRHVRRLVPAA